MKIKKLGRISKVKFGHCGYQNAEFGFYVYFEGNGWGTTDNWSFWDHKLVSINEDTDWDETVRDAKMADICRRISALLNTAKVNHIDALKDMPIEATFEGRKLDSWRILTEVLNIGGK